MAEGLGEGGNVYSWRAVPRLAPCSLWSSAEDLWRSLQTPRPSLSILKGGDGHTQNGRHSGDRAHGGIAMTSEVLSAVKTLFLVF